MAGRLSAASAWNLSFNLFGKSQSLALIAAGSIIDGIAGVGVLVTALAACLLGQALADLGLASELGRLSVAFPSRATVDRCTRAVARQAPIALLLGPAVYLLLGPTSPSGPFLVVIGVLSALLVATFGLTAVLNGLGDFRSPATRLGALRLLSGIAAIGAASIEPTPMAVLSCFAVAEGIGLAVLGMSVRRARDSLPEIDHPDSGVRRAHVWVGAATIVNMLTSQGDTILVASILSPRELGIYATASVLQNGVATFAFALAAPTGLRSIAATLRSEIPTGARLLKNAIVIAGTAAVILAVFTWVVTQLVGDSIDNLAGLASGTGPVVLALCLASGPLYAIGTLFIARGVGFARHRKVGVCQIEVGIVAVGAIVVGASVAAAVGAAAGTLVRDAVRVAVASRLIGAPEPQDTPHDAAPANV